jgi:hypothetical protein
MNISSKIKTLGLCLACVFALAVVYPIMRVPGTEVHAQVQSTSLITINALPDLTGNGSVQQVSSIGGTCRWVQFVALPGNQAAIRIGDVNVGPGRGIMVEPGIPYLTPPAAGYSFALGSLYFYAASNDKLSVACAQ